VDSIGQKPTEVQGVSRKLCLACNRQFEDAGLSHCPHDSTQLVNLGKDETQAWIGKTINGKYKVLEAVGKGGMGTVFRAEQLGLGRHVAIKMLKAQLSEDKVSVKRFEQEAHASASLQHKNLIMLHDYGMIDDKQPYLVMEFLPGESLGQIIKENGCVNPVRCLRIFNQVMEGLTAAHAKGVVHRDIKPSNIILAKVANQDEDVVKVVDFGLAKLMPWSGKESQHLTKTGEVFGSPIYMSPEQCQGKKLEPSSDIYSVGVTLYEALTGKPPFKGRNVVETASMHISSQPPPFELVRSDLRLSNKLQAVVFKALDKDPVRRYLDMEDFRKALTDAISGPGANDGFLTDSEVADIPAESTQPVKKTDLENYRPPNVAAQRQMEQKQEENRRKLTAGLVGICIILVLSAGGVYVWSLMNTQHGGTSGGNSPISEAIGIVTYLNLEREEDQKKGPYTIKEVHLMTGPPDQDPPKIVKLTGAISKGLRFSESLRLGSNWNCKTSNGALSQVDAEKTGGQAHIYNAWSCLMDFVSAVNDANFTKMETLVDSYHGGDANKLDQLKNNWKGYKLKEQPPTDEAQEIINSLTDIYAKRPLPQNVKVTTYDDQTVTFLLDKSALFTKDNQPLSERIFQKFTISYLDNTWKIVLFGKEEDEATSQWDKY
jgi:serine/threonine protein kinase